MSVHAIIQAELGRRGMRQFPVRQVQAYTVDGAMDTDTDPFSIDLHLPREDMSILLQRDTEVRVNLFTTNLRKRIEPLHSGIADRVTFDSDDRILSITGRDFSCVATETDAAPGKWKHQRPAAFITQRAHKLGISNVKIAPCSELNRIVTDGSEKEWALWYRIMREKKMWLWFEPSGRMLGDKLHYSIAATYFFGDAPRSGSSRSGWLPVERIEITKSTDGRVGEAWVYGENPKTNVTYFGRGIDTSIRSWKRKPIKILTSTTAKSPVDVKQQADDEIFESIVGATEVTLTIRDPGFVVKQNSMARVNLPDLGFSGLWFVVGVRVRGGMDGNFQEVRLREKGFALSKRVPDEPKLQNPTNDPADRTVPSSITSALRGAGVPYADAFMQATQEFRDGWDFATFLGVLLSIAAHESGGDTMNIKNIRQSKPGAINGVEWYDKPTNVVGATVTTPDGTTEGPSDLASEIEQWMSTFGNSAGSSHNPFGSSEAGVGPMQLTSAGYKEWADAYGWAGVPRSGEYDGGRWNAKSNIRAGARALAEKLKAVHADPNNSDDIWRGVAAYNGSPASGTYTKTVRGLFNTQFSAIAAGVVQASTALPAGEKVNVTVGDHTFKFPKNMPDIAAKAINFALRHLGDPYRKAGPNGANDQLSNGRLLYDCSSLVTAALYAGGVRGLDNPHLGHHGETTYTLWDKGTNVAKDNLLPGDAVFFESLGHMGMYLDDGLFIHDPHTGDVVKISGLGGSWYRENYVGARRYITWKGQPND